MDIFIVIFKDGSIKQSNNFTPMLRRLVDEKKVKEIIDISKPTEPRILKNGGWNKLFIVG